MQMKIKEKMIAVVMAFAMMFTFIFAGESSEVIAAAKTKALDVFSTPVLLYNRIVRLSSIKSKKFL